MRRIYEHQFDWVLAEALYDDGYSVSDVARELGVSPNAVAMAVRLDEAGRRAAVLGEKDACECGRPKLRWSLRCKKCFEREAADSANARVVGPDAEGLFWLECRCSSCKEWLIWTDFYKGHRVAPARGGRKTRCKVCDNAARREYRDRAKIPCAVCGKPRLPGKEKKRTDRPSQPHPFCRDCWSHSDDPRVVLARSEAAKQAARTLRRRATA